MKLTVAAEDAANVRAMLKKRFPAIIYSEQKWGNSLRFEVAGNPDVLREAEDEYWRLWRERQFDGRDER